jgi:hypothetical protein
MIHIPLNNREKPLWHGACDKQTVMQIRDDEAKAMRSNNTENLKMSHKVFSSLVQDSGREELARCIRLLSMYLAMYKRNFGEMSMSDYLDLSGSPLVNQELAGLVKQGLEEATAMLTLVIQEKDEHPAEPLYAPAPTDVIN